MPKLRVHNLTVSLDGYAAGPNQGLDNPLGERGTRLHEWLFATRAFRRTHGMEGGEGGLDDQFIADGEAGIGATIMGRNMFGPVRGPWGSDPWTGWWGEDPPFHHPVFVLTHHPRPAIPMQGGTVSILWTEVRRPLASWRLRPQMERTSGWVGAHRPSSSTSDPD